MFLGGVTDLRELQWKYYTSALKFIFNPLQTDPKYCNNEAPIGSRLIPVERLSMLYGVEKASQKIKI